MLMLYTYISYSSAVITNVSQNIGLVGVPHLVVCDMKYHTSIPSTDRCGSVPHLLYVTKPFKKRTWGGGVCDGLVQGRTWTIFYIPLFAITVYISNPSI